MPGFDGTGPRGAGPMTGGARGFCQPERGPAPHGGNSSSERYSCCPCPFDVPRGVGRGGLPRGGGRGRAFGGGRGGW